MLWRRASKKEEVSEIPTCALWDLILDMNWEGVEKRLQTHPIDSQYVDGHWRETTLALATQLDPPVRVLRQIIHSYPEALLIPSSANGDLPLHVVCRYRGSAGVIEELLQLCPESAVKQTKFGAHPLHILWKFRDEGAEQDEIFWNKVILILRAVASFRDDEKLSRENGVDKIVHAAISLKAMSCPIEILEFLLLKFPNQTYERDSQGMLPLHVAVGPTAWSQTTRRKYRPREKQFISMLLGVNSKAAKERLPSNHGRYPLHIALTNRHVWHGGIQTLLDAAPEVLLEPCPIEKLYPFQLAAIPVGETTVDVETIFYLLRSQPDVLRCFKFKNKDATHKMAPTRRLNRGNIYREALLGAVAAVLTGHVIGKLF